MSEIDDIFASKDKSKPSPSTSVSLLKAKKKAKKTKLASANEDPPHASSSALTPASKKRPPPETVVDTSANVPSLKRQKKETGPGKVRTRQSTKLNSSEPDGGLFKDSRGSGARRTTDEGWSIYKEDELGIRDDGGDTPLCPFDCDCCQVSDASPYPIHMHYEIVDLFPQILCEYAGFCYFTNFQALSKPHRPSNPRLVEVNL